MKPPFSTNADNDGGNDLMRPFFLLFLPIVTALVILSLIFAAGW